MDLESVGMITMGIGMLIIFLISRFFTPTRNNVLFGFGVILVGILVFWIGRKKDIKIKVGVDKDENEDE